MVGNDRPEVAGAKLAPDRQLAGGHRLILTHGIDRCKMLLSLDQS
jgi:hypothetical protein